MPPVLPQLPGFASPQAHHDRSQRSNQHANPIAWHLGSHRASPFSPCALRHLARLALILLFTLGAVPGIPAFDLLPQAAGQDVAPFLPALGSPATEFRASPGLSASAAPGQPLPAT